VEELYRCSFLCECKAGRSAWTESRTSISLFGMAPPCRLGLQAGYVGPVNAWGSGLSIILFYSA